MAIPDVLGDGRRALPSSGLQAQFIRTLGYVAISVAICSVVGYPVAYYVARYGGRLKVLLLTLMIAPFWMSYLMRMLAWVNLLSVKPDDPGACQPSPAPHPVRDTSRSIGAAARSPTYTVILGLVYGYIPFFILPLYAALDRIDKSQLEASRDMGASPASTFWRVTLPLSKQGILAGAVIITLPMFGDYYTPNLMTASPENTMIGNAIDFALQGGQGQQPKGAALTLAPVRVHRRADDLLPRERLASGEGGPAVTTAEATLPRETALPKVGRLRSFFSNPWGKPRLLSVWTWLYIIWTIAPVLIAVQFSFNNGRSRSTFQGFSTAVVRGDLERGVGELRRHVAPGPHAEPQARPADHADRDGPRRRASPSGSPDGEAAAPAPRTS